MSEPAGAPLPQARVERLGRPSWAWLLPLAALGLALWLGARAWSERGPLIRVRAADGHGTKAGDLVRHRGIAVGEIESVELAGDLSEVLLTARLQRSAAGLARAGTRFWVVRPSLGLEGAQGLETVLGARYLAVLPGPADAAPQEEFVALAEAPLPGLDEEGALEVVLEADSRSGLSRGAPVLYRGIQVGTVVSVGLASDATAVELRVAVRPAYGELVRTDTRFWELGGAEVSLGFSGIDLELGSLRSLLSGGIALATPTQPGPRASTGQRFPLASEPEKEWLEWRPALPIGSALLPPGARLPELLRLRLVWKQGRLIARSRSREGWALCVEERLVAPADLLTPPDGAEQDSCFLEFLGEQHPLTRPPDWAANGLAARSVDWEESVGPPREPGFALGEPVDCIATTDPSVAPVAISAFHLRNEGACWNVGQELAFDPSLHGAAVISRVDGKLIGLLLVEEGRGKIASISEPLQCW